jgi:hypothetical protein
VQYPCSEDRVILVIWEVGIKWITVWGQPGQKGSEIPILTNLDLMVLTCYPSQTGGINERIMIQADLCKTWDLIPEITKAKRAGVMSQVVAHLTSKHKILSSNTSMENIKYINLFNKNLWDCLMGRQEKGKGNIIERMLL